MDGLPQLGQKKKFCLIELVFNAIFKIFGKQIYESVTDKQ